MPRIPGTARRAPARRADGGPRAPRPRSLSRRRDPLVGGADQGTLDREEPSAMSTTMTSPAGHPRKLVGQPARSATTTTGRPARSCPSTSASETSPPPKATHAAARRQRIDDALAAGRLVTPGRARGTDDHVVMRLGRDVAAPGHTQHAERCHAEPPARVTARHADHPDDASIGATGHDHRPARSRRRDDRLDHGREALGEIVRAVVATPAMTRWRRRHPTRARPPSPQRRAAA